MYRLGCTSDSHMSKLGHVALEQSFTPVSMAYRLRLGQGIPSRGKGNTRLGLQRCPQANKISAQEQCRCFPAGLL